MNDATWEQKLEAMAGLGEASLKMAKPGTWYVDQPGVDIKASTRDGKALDLTGETPEKAVVARWAALTGGALVEHKRGRLLRRVRWNGFMWADVQEDAEPAAATT
jgi:hypothetical protein